MSLIWSTATGPPSCSPPRERGERAPSTGSRCSSPRRHSASSCEPEPRADEPLLQAPGAADKDRRPGDERQEAEGAWIGITRPSRQGASPRFLTDVIVEMGLATRAQVDDALESSRSLGITPERVLLQNGALTHDALS